MDRETCFSSYNPLFMLHIVIHRNTGQIKFADIYVFQACKYVSFSNLTGSLLAIFLLSCLHIKSCFLNRNLRIQTAAHVVDTPLHKMATCAS